MHSRCPGLSPDIVSIWLPLQDSAEENGWWFLLLAYRGGRFDDLFELAVGEVAGGYRQTRSCIFTVALSMAIASRSSYTGWR